MEQSDKSDAVQILVVFGHLKTLTAEWCSETGPFTQLSSDLFHSQLIRKYLRYETPFLVKILKT